MVALESTAASLAKTIIQKAAGAWIADRRTAEERKKELSELLKPWFRRESPEQRILAEAVSDLKSYSHEFRRLDDREREAALLAVGDTFKHADLTDRTLFDVDLDPAKLASRLRDRQPQAKTNAWLSEAGGAFYDVALDRCCKLYVRAVEQVQAFVARAVAEMLSRNSDLSDQLADGFSDLRDQFARVIDAQQEAQAAAAAPDGGVTLAGRPLEEVTDPFDLEVHRPVQPEDAPPGLPVLPLYEEREHDEVLGQVVRAAVDGRSGIAVLVGGSSTGKTRACWEALALLRGQGPPWRLWHPIHPDVALRELPGIEPRTVVWLNEAQLYLKTTDERGERVAAGLRARLQDPGRAPVLVLATLWPEYWHSLIARPADGEDRHAQARQLLAGHDITVPAAFTPAQMSQLARATDARMALAARSAPDGAVIQFLAGAPELLDRYRNAPLPAARALMEAAMDARRLGMGAGLPQAFLEAAAPGYLTDAQWDALGEDWLKQALAYTTEDAKGVPGPLTRIRPHPARHAARGHGDQHASMTAAAGPLYRLADYLDQHGRTHRASQIPPPEFWSAAAAYAAPGDQGALGDAASDRGLDRAAAQLYKNAAARGDLGAVFYLSDPLRCLRGDIRPALWAAAHVPLGDPGPVAGLLYRLRGAGAQEQATAALLRRDPATHVALDDPGDVASLLDMLREAGAQEQAAALLRRDNAYTLARLLDNLQRAGAQEQAAALASRAATHVPLDDPFITATAALLRRDPAHVPLDDPSAVALLLDNLREAGAHDQAAALASRAATHVPLDDPGAVALLLDNLRKAGAHDQVTVLLRRDPAAHVTLDRPSAVALLLDNLRKAGAHDQAAALASRAATHVPLDDPGAVALLLDNLRKAGAQEQAAALLRRDPAACVALDRPGAVDRLLDSLRKAGAQEQAAALASRAAAHVPLDRPGAVAGLLDSLRKAGAQEQAAALASRAATHVPLDRLGGVANLLDRLRAAGADEQAAALAARAAAHVALDDPDAVARLLDTMREAGAREQATALAARLPAAGMFGLFLKQNGPADQFCFGREADGTPAAPWGWEDLDLWPKRQTESEQPRRHPAI